jgi:hypothetical protein
MSRRPPHRQHDRRRNQRAQPDPAHASDLPSTAWATQSTSHLPALTTQAMLPGRSSTTADATRCRCRPVPNLPLLLFLRQKIGHDRRGPALAVGCAMALAVHSPISRAPRVPPWRCAGFSARAARGGCPRGSCSGSAGAGVSIGPIIRRAATTRRYAMMAVSTACLFRPLSDCGVVRGQRGLECLGVESRHARPLRKVRPGPRTNPAAKREAPCDLTYRAARTRPPANALAVMAGRSLGTWAKERPQSNTRKMAEPERIRPAEVASCWPGTMRRSGRPDDDAAGFRRRSAQAAKFRKVSEYRAESRGNARRSKAPVSEPKSWSDRNSYAPPLGTILQRIAAGQGNNQGNEPSGCNSPGAQ